MQLKADTWWVTYDGAETLPLYLTPMAFRAKGSEILLDKTAGRYHDYFLMCSPESNEVLIVDPYWAVEWLLTGEASAP